MQWEGEIRWAEFLAQGEAINTPGLKERSSQISGLTAMGNLISASAVSHPNTGSAATGLP